MLVYAGCFAREAVTALLRNLLSHPENYDTLLTLDAPECGRVSYRQGDRYRFTLIALAGGEKLLQRALQRLGELPELSTNITTIQNDTAANKRGS